MLDRGKILTVSIILISIVLFSVIYLTKKNTNSQSEGNKLLQFEDNIDHYTSVAESLWNHSDYFEWLYDETGSRSIGNHFSNHSLCGLLNTNLKAYFSQDEWNVYEEFIKQHEPNCITYYPLYYSSEGEIYSLPVIEFNYIEKQSGSLFILSSFYYICMQNELEEKVENTIDYFGYGRDSIPQKINGSWYYYTEHKSIP